MDMGKEDLIESVCAEKNIYFILAAAAAAVVVVELTLALGDVKQLPIHSFMIFFSRHCFAPICNRWEIGGAMDIGMREG